MKIISINDLQNADKIEKLCRDNKEPIFVEREGNIQFVIFDFDDYNDLTCKLNEAKFVNKGLEDLRIGNIVDGNVLKDKIKKKL